MFLEQLLIIMETQTLIYLAGLVDGVGKFEVNVSPHDNYATGFRFEPKVRLTLNESDTALLGMLDEYCEEHGLKYSIEERGGDSIRFIIQDPHEICQFVNPFGEYLIRKYDEASIMLNEIVPAVKDGKHREKEGFYELMEYVDILRHGNRGKDAKYTQEWFEDEWNLAK